MLWGVSEHCAGMQKTAHDYTVNVMYDNNNIISLCDVTCAWFNINITIYSALQYFITMYNAVTIDKRYQDLALTS